ncbi:MAG: hypothetical protein WCL27_18170, partial [Betaproteobacteria bacterium]
MSKLYSSSKLAGFSLTLLLVPFLTGCVQNPPKPPVELSKCQRQVGSVIVEAAQVSQAQAWDRNSLTVPVQEIEGMVQETMCFRLLENTKPAMDSGMAAIMA